MKDYNNAIFINVSGGVIQSIDKIPENVQVIVRNYDDVEDYPWHEKSLDENGNECIESIHCSENETGKQKFTVIFAERVNSFSPPFTRREFIECEPEAFRAYIEENFGWGMVYFIFKGHCESA